MGEKREFMLLAVQSIRSASLVILAVFSVTMTTFLRAPPPADYEHARRDKERNVKQTVRDKQSPLAAPL